MSGSEEMNRLLRRTIRIEKALQTGSCDKHEPDAGLFVEIAAVQWIV